MRFCGLFDDEGKKQFLLKIPQQLVTVDRSKSRET